MPHRCYRFTSPHYRLGPAAPLDMRTITLYLLTHGGSQQQLDPSHFLCSGLLTHLILSQCHLFLRPSYTGVPSSESEPPTLHRCDLILLLLHGVWRPAIARTVWYALIIPDGGYEPTLSLDTSEQISHQQQPLLPIVNWIHNWFLGVWSTAKV